LPEQKTEHNKTIIFREEAGEGEHVLRAEKKIKIFLSSLPGGKETIETQNSRGSNETTIVDSEETGEGKKVVDVFDLITNLKANAARSNQEKNAVRNGGRGGECGSLNIDHGREQWN